MATQRDTKPVVFASLGSLIIDDIRYQDGTEKRDILGGAGIYAIYGMRVWCNGPQESKKIGYISQEGFDHPKQISDQLESLDISLIHRVHMDQHTTRGLNIFQSDDQRDFEYIHPIIRTTADDPPEDWVPTLKAIHIISSPERAIEIVTRWREREATNKVTQACSFIWEPVPWSCRAERLDLVCQAAGMVDILTPNHGEAACLLGAPTANDKEDVEVVAKRIRELLNGKDTTVIIRSGKLGALVAAKDGQHTWVPAYHTSNSRVRDVTGAGNAFCGGLCVGWVESNKDPVMACVYGSVSASFAVEQVGLPTCNRDGNYQEIWNHGPSTVERLEELKERLEPKA